MKNVLLGSIFVIMVLCFCGCNKKKDVTTFDWGDGYASSYELTTYKDALGITGKSGDEKCWLISYIYNDEVVDESTIPYIDSIGNESAERACSKTATIKRVDKVLNEEVE